MTIKFVDLAGLNYFKNKLNILDDDAVNALINQAFATYSQNLVTIVTELPETGEEGKLYLMVDGGNVNLYNIFAWENNAWRELGKSSLSVTIDDTLSTTSTNPVQNKVLTAALNEKLTSADLVALTDDEIDSLFE